MSQACSFFLRVTCANGRLRSWLRHEQQSSAAALTTFTHNRAQRQKTARAGSEVRVEPQGEVPDELLPQPELFTLYDEEPGGRRPDSLAESGPPLVWVGPAGCRGTAVPSLALANLGGGSEMVDSSALSWLVDHTLNRRALLTWPSCRSRTRRELRGWRRGRGRKERGGRRSCPRLPPLVLFLPTQLALGDLIIISMAGAWFDIGYIFIRQSWWLSGNFLSFYVCKDLGSEVDSPALARRLRRLMSTGGDDFWKMLVCSALCLVPRRFLALASVYGGSWKNSSFFFVKVDTDSIWELTSGKCLVFLRNVWFDSGY